MGCGKNGSKKNIGATPPTEAKPRPQLLTSASGHVVSDSGSALLTLHLPVVVLYFPPHKRQVAQTWTWSSVVQQVPILEARHAIPVSIKEVDSSKSLGV